MARLAVFLVAFALGFLVAAQASAEEQRCIDLDSVCQCSEPLDTSTYVCTNGNCSIGHDLQINPTDTNSKQCYGGNSIGIGDFNTEQNQGQFLLTPDETGMPSGNSVGKVWRWNKGHGALWGHSNSTIQSTTKRICYRHYFRLSPDYDGGNIATDSSSPNCDAGKFSHFKWSNGFQLMGGSGGCKGRSCPFQLAPVSWNGVTGPNNMPYTQSNPLKYSECYGQWCRHESCVSGDFSGGTGHFIAEGYVTRLSDTGPNAGKRIDWPPYDMGTGGPGLYLQFPWIVDGFRGDWNDSLTCSNGIPQDATNRGTWREVSHLMAAEWPAGGDSDVHLGEFIGPASEIEGGGVDTGAPHVLSTSPANGQGNVAVSANAVVTFDEGMLASSLNTSTVQVTDGGVPVAATVTPGTFTATVDPTANLAVNHVYGIKVTTGVEDDSPATNNLVSEYTSTFTTEQASAGALSFDQNSYTVHEGDGQLCGYVRRTLGSGLAISVQVHTSSGNAIENTDFTEPNALLEWQDNNTDLKQWCVPITQDAIDETGTAQTFTIALSSPMGGASLISPSSVTATILDDDGAARTITISPTTASIAEAGGQQIITGTMTGAPCYNNVLSVKVDLGGTADINDDYTFDKVGFDGTNYFTWFTFNAGSTTTSRTLSAITDVVSDNGETAILTLSDQDDCGTEATLVAGTSTTTITEVASPPTVNLSVDDTSISPENGGTATITATLSATTAADVLVDATGCNGTGVDALVSVDWSGYDAIMTIPANTLTSNMDIVAINDLIDETDESICIQITGVSSNAILGATRSTETFITDDDAAPTVTLTCDDLTVSEVGGVSTCTAESSTISSFDMTVALAYAGTAVNFQDYTRSGDSIVIPNGSTTGNVVVTGQNELFNDGDKDVVVTIDDCTHCTEDGTQSQTITIGNDDLADPSCDPYKVWFIPNRWWYLVRPTCN